MSVLTISVVGIPTTSEALLAVQVLAEAGARQRGTSLVGSDLRLFEYGPISASFHQAVANVEEMVSPFSLGRCYELGLTAATRRTAGAHLTPETVARQLVGIMDRPHPDDRVLDPAVGGAAFLLAAADSLVGAGGSPEQVRTQLSGIDIDANAVAVAEAALALWGLDRQIDVVALPLLRQGDGLLDPLPAADRVVGNPPFLNQLRLSSSHTRARRAALRDRWGDLVGAYTDDAWLFLAAGLEALRTEGSLAMVQPISILAARHSKAVRQYANERGSLTGLWVAVDQVFDAAVKVCGLIIAAKSGDDQVRPERQVQRFCGADFVRCPPLTRQPAPTEWGAAASIALGVPAVSQLKEGGGVVGDMATATAGFRDQFYGLVPYVCEADDHAEKGDDPARLVTVGMIDVLGLSWGEREFKFAKQSYVRPIVDLDALRVGDPKLSKWVSARQRPKLLMATQTRVVEVWADAVGSAVPTTPVISIEPHEDVDLWLLAAALSAPPVSAYFMATKFGTAMALNSMKLAARDVVETPLPVHQEPWHDAAALLRGGHTKSVEDFETFAHLMSAAYGESDSRVARWWLQRLCLS